MTKLYIPGFEYPFRCSEDFYEALVRAKVWFSVNRVNDTLRVTSRNSDAPLTDAEKNRLRFILTTHGNCPFEIVFDN